MAWPTPRMVRGHVHFAAHVSIANEYELCVRAVVQDVGNCMNEDIGAFLDNQAPDEQNHRVEGVDAVLLLDAAWVEGHSRRPGG